MKRLALPFIILALLLPAAAPLSQDRKLLTGAGGPPAGGGAFSPSDLSGLVLWLKADAITGLSDGDPVTTWDDSHTSNNDATQSTGSAKPTYKVNILNGKPVLQFDGVDDTMTVSATPTVGTVFVVAVRTSNPSNYIGLLTGASDPGGANYYFTTGVDSTSWDTGNPWITTFYRDGTAGVTTVDASWHLYGGTDATPNAPMAGIAIGRDRSNGRNWPGRIAEIILYDSVLSTGNRQSVETYISGKYAIF